MVLNKYRGIANRILTPAARAFSGLDPNTISAVSLLFAFLAGIAFVFGDKSSFEDIFKPGEGHQIYIMLAIASICIFLNGFLDAVDGFVARMTGRSTKRGDLFDHAIDRYADIFILGGIMLSPYCDPVLGAFALIAVLMTSYMGTQAQALGCGRAYGGILGRADRLVILIVVPLLQMWINYYIPSGRLPFPGMFRLTLLEFTMLWFFIAGNITAVYRGVQSWRELREQDEPQKKLDQYFAVSGSGKVISNPTKRSTPTFQKPAPVENKNRPITEPKRPKPKAKLPSKPKPKHRKKLKPKPKPKTSSASHDIAWDEPRPVEIRTQKKGVQPTDKKTKPKPLKLKTKPATTKKMTKPAPKKGTSLRKKKTGTGTPPKGTKKTNIKRRTTKRLKKY
jgi:archaetidylinositol phosphate synthase